MIKLRRLKINRFRNVAPGTEIVFADGFNILLGKNGTGKTTLLRLLEAVTRLNFFSFRDEDFDLEFDCAGDELDVHMHVGNRRGADVPTDLGMQVPGLERGRPGFVSTVRADLVFGPADKRINAIIETAEGRTTTQIGAEVLPHPSPALPTSAFFSLELLMLLRARFPKPRASLLLYWRESRRFDESLGFYDFIKEEKFSLFPEGLPLPPNHWISLAHNLVFSGEDAKEPKQPILSFNAESLPMLDAVRLALGTRSVELQLTLLSSEPSGSASYGNLRFWLTRRDGSQYGDELLSYGQKRLLSFLYYLEANQEIVIADELVNGLHHDWIDLCVKGIGKRQAFLTSQNPLLMDYTEFDSADEVRRSFILCELAYEGDTQRLLWRNMTEGEAQGVFEAGEVGIEHMGTILRNQGLW